MFELKILWSHGDVYIEDLPSRDLALDRLAHIAKTDNPINTELRVMGSQWGGHIEDPSYDGVPDTCNVIAFYTVHQITRKETD